MRRRRSLGGGFSPRKLFADGTVGAWYDPSDYSTLFQDSAGTTPVTAVEQPVRLMRDKSGNNNHATAPNDLSRPVLRARYNLLTYSEQFNSARWAVGTYNTTGVDNDRIAPDGTTTADKITVVVSGNNRIQQVIPVVPNTNYTVSFYVYGGTSTSYLMNIYDSIGATWIVYAYDYSAQVSTTGWTRITKAFTTPAGCTSIILQPIRDVIGTGTFWIWGAMLNTGSSAGTYQRIAAATDYATAGFLPYLAFDGSDDSFSTGSINFSATDKMSVCAGVTKLSDAAAGTLIELTADATANNGGFALRAPDSATSNYGAITRGTVASNTRLATTYAAPITNVLTTLLNNGGALSADQITVRINAATPTLSAGTATTAGNFANAAMYIGRRINASRPFNGRIYGLIVADKTLSASELSATESWMAAKTGVAL